MPHEFLEQIKSPFQLFASFLDNQRNVFFGRDSEIEDLFDMIQESNVVLVFGKSGTGKTSLVRCGLINETKLFNWTNIVIRRELHFVDSLKSKLFEQIDSIEPSLGITTESPISTLLREVFISTFQPILIIFDQFEDIFNFGTDEERGAFYDTIKAIFDAKTSCKIVFIIKEEYLASLDEFEKHIPRIFAKRIRIELFDTAKCREIILKSFEKFDIKIDNVSVLDNFHKVDNIVSKIEDHSGYINPPILQVFLDQLWEAAYRLSGCPVSIPSDIIDYIGDVGDILNVFIEGKIATQDYISNADAWKFLKLFVANDSNFRQRVSIAEYSSLPKSNLEAIVQHFLLNRIIQPCRDGTYELTHEVLIPVIQSKKITQIRARLTNPTISGNPYVGLKSFDKADAIKFYGRDNVIDAVCKKIHSNIFSVVVGNSGSGKSSLIKAGVIPKFESDGYTILNILKTGEGLIASMNSEVLRINESGKGYLLLIDQFEELVTRINSSSLRSQILHRIHQLVKEQEMLGDDAKLRIVITIRADFELQLSILEPLAAHWKSGKYIIPPFTIEEIRQAIEEPAYQAGFEFSPPSLVDLIAEEVYTSQTTGLLPLMSFSLSELYNTTVRAENDDYLFTESRYRANGGVMGCLQIRSDRLYENCEMKSKLIMRKIIMRLISMGTADLASRQASGEEFKFYDEEDDFRGKQILEDLITNRLVVESVGRSNVNGYQVEQRFFEPAHDSWIRSWPRIWEWLDESTKETLTFRSHLEDAILQVPKGGSLWDSDPKLELFENLLELDSNWLNRSETIFIKNSIAKRDKRIRRQRNRKVINVVLFVSSAILAVFLYDFYKSLEVANALMAVSNVEQTGDDTIKFGVLRRAYQAISHANNDRPMLKSGDSSAKEKLVYYFNELNLGKSYSFSGVTTCSIFDNDEKLIVFNEKTGKSTLMNRHKREIGSPWVGAGFVVDGRPIIAKVSNGIVTFSDFENRSISGKCFLGRDKIQASDIMSIKAPTGGEFTSFILSYRDSNSRETFELYKKDKHTGEFSSARLINKLTSVDSINSSDIYGGEFLRSGEILISRLKVANTLLPETSICRINRDSFNLNSWTLVKSFLLSVDKSTILINTANGKWSKFLSDKILPIEGSYSEAIFGVNGSYVLFDSTDISHFDPNGTRIGSLKIAKILSNTGSKHSVVDYQAGKVLIRSESVIYRSQNPQIMWGVYDFSKMIYTRMTSDSIQDCKLSKDGGSIVIVKSVDRFRPDILLYEVISMASLSGPTLRFQINRPESTIVLNDLLLRSNVKRIGSSVYLSRGASFFETTKTIYSDELYVYDSQDPSILRSDDIDLILKSRFRLGELKSNEVSKILQENSVLAALRSTIFSRIFQN